MTRFDDPEVFTAGAVGPPGSRVFFLHVRDNGTTRSVKIEKQHVMALAEYLEGLLRDLPPAAEVPDTPDLTDVPEPEWVVGSIGVGYENDKDRVVIVAEELVGEDELGETLRVAITRAQVRALIDRAEELMAGGRPPCRVCGGPIDPAGHVCPRAN